jgi:hypothetical protein
MGVRVGMNMAIVLLRGMLGCGGGIMVMTVLVAMSAVIMVIVR